MVRLLIGCFYVSLMTCLWFISFADIATGQYKNAMFEFTVVGMLTAKIMEQV